MQDSCLANCAVLHQLCCSASTVLLTLGGQTPGSGSSCRRAAAAAAFPGAGLQVLDSHVLPYCQTCIVVYHMGAAKMWSPRCSQV
jgi:hypothetical protein